MANDLEIKLGVKIEDPIDVMAEINAILDSINDRVCIQKCFTLNPKFLM